MQSNSKEIFMCEPTTVMVASLVLSAAATGYSMHQQNKAQKEAAAAQKEAQREAEIELKSKTPEMKTEDTSAQRTRALKAYRAGMLKNIKTSGIGLPTQAETLNQSAAGGLKTKIGE
jgi:hypothetical protein